MLGLVHMALRRYSNRVMANFLAIIPFELVTARDALVLAWGKHALTNMRRILDSPYCVQSSCAGLSPEVQLNVLRASRRRQMAVETERQERESGCHITAMSSVIAGDPMLDPIITDKAKKKRKKRPWKIKWILKKLA